MITDAEAIRFSDEVIRPFADRMAQLAYEAQAIKDIWFARNMGAKFPLGEVIDDTANSAGDGRAYHPIISLACMI